MDANKGEGIIRQLVNYVKKIFDKTEKLSGSELDKALIASARSEEEAESVREMCENVDLYYRKRKEFRESGLEPGKWFEKEIEETVKSVYPEADAEDLDEVKAAVAKQLETEIEVAADLVKSEMDPVAEAIEKDVQ